MNETARAVFVLGSSRSGTTLVHQLLASHSKVAGVYETDILKKLNAPRTDLSDAVKRFSRSETENQVVQEHFSRVFAGVGPQDVGPYQFLDQYCEAQRLHFAADTYVEKTPIHAFFINGLISQIPNAKIIVIARDPRAIVASRLKTPRIGRGKSWHLPRKIQFYLNLSSTMFTYEVMDPWFAANGMTNNPVIFIKYEDIVADPETALTPIWDFLSLPKEDVHTRINPRDLRLQARNRAGLMNSSFGYRQTESVARTSAENWHGTLTPSEGQFATDCLANMDLKYVEALYPELAHTKRSPKIFLMKRWSKADRYFFLRKNIKALETLEGSPQPVVKDALKPIS